MRITCNSGLSFSAMASSSHYSTPKTSNAVEYSAVEIGFPNLKVEKLIPYAEDKDHPTNTVYAYVPTEILASVIMENGGIDNVQQCNFKMKGFAIPEDKRIDQYFINLTPHELNIYIDKKKETPMTIPPSGKIARVQTEYQFSHKVSMIPIYKVKYGDVQNLPPYRTHTTTNYIVSGMVKSAAPDRVDVYSPGELLRDSQGKPIGCLGLKK